MLAPSAETVAERRRLLYNSRERRRVNNINVTIMELEIKVEKVVGPERRRSKLKILKGACDAMDIYEEENRTLKSKVQEYQDKIKEFEAKMTKMERELEDQKRQAVLSNLNSWPTPFTPQIEPDSQSNN